MSEAKPTDAAMRAARSVLKRGKIFLALDYASRGRAINSVALTIDGAGGFPRTGAALRSMYELACVLLKKARRSACLIEGDANCQCDLCKARAALAEGA